MNPLSMMDGMKKQFTFMVPNMVMMGIIPYFFSGFVLVKVPFPLTYCFKSMLQRGVDLGTLDVSYVSSMAWYGIVMFGLRGFYKLVLGEDSEALDEAKAAQAQMGMGMMGGMGGGPGGMGFNAEAAFKMERDSLDLVKHKWLVNDAEKNLLGPRYPTRPMDEYIAPSSSDSASAKKALEQKEMKLAEKEEKKEKKRRQKTVKVKAR